jgi:hypothetical protein
LLLSQQLFASEERCQKILDLIPDESKKKSVQRYFSESLLCSMYVFEIDMWCILFLDVANELHEKWQGNRRSSISKEDVNTTRWEQLKTNLQLGKNKVRVSAPAVILNQSFVGAYLVPCILITFIQKLFNLIVYISLFWSHLNDIAIFWIQGQGLRRCVEEIVFSYTYPRLDMEVKDNSSETWFLQNVN